MEIELRLAQRVKAARLAKRWSQEELADRAGLHRTFISQIERGVKISTIRTVDRIARALEVKNGDLLD
ncbi:MAG: XRE family transcriptional regulator [Brevundimonas sp.]|nr:MAG: XRE family transcriptional regulator [Brevundimonas sp.]